MGWYQLIHFTLPNAKTHSYCPLRTNNLASIRADDAEEQLLFVLNTGTPVRPSSETRTVYASDLIVNPKKDTCKTVNGHPIRPSWTCSVTFDLTSKSPFCLQANMKLFERRN